MDVNEKTIWDALMGYMGNPFGVAGLMANLYAESGLESTKLENICRKRIKEAGGPFYTDQTYTDAVDTGQISREEFLHPLPGKQYGYGLAQWTSVDRKSKLYDLAKSKGVSIGDLETHLEFLLKELSTSYKGVLSVLKTATSVKMASDKVLTEFECPSDQSASMKAKRASYGQMYYDKYQKLGGSDMSAIEMLLKIADGEVGYLEKKNNSQLDDKTANAGKNNYTKYARDLYPSLQGQAWCDMFVDWCFVQAFGISTANRLIGGGFSAYTPTSAQYYKDKGWWRTIPEPGDQIFFKNTSRICHTGIVTRISGGNVYTIEGNTSAGSAVIPNGGAVCRKSYSLGASGIAGYGHPDWSLVESPKYTIGWNHDNGGWWYADTKDTYIKSCWKDINKHRYYFDDDGYAVTGWKEIDGKWYYFEPRAGHPIECALYVSDQNGVQDIGKF